MAKYKIVIVDRPGWYEPWIEQEEISKHVDAEVLVGPLLLGASKEFDPELAARGQTVRELSTYGGGWLPASHFKDDMFAQMAGDADAIIVTRPKITGAVLDRMPYVRAIGRPGIGYDMIDIDACTERGVAVFNSPGFCAREVADHTMMLALNCARKTPILYNAMRRGIYDLNMIWPVQAVYEMTLGLLAFGDIPREVAKRAKAHEFRVIAHDPFVDQKIADEYGVTLVSLEELLRQSDILSVHAPLSAKTHHMLGEREFALMKPTAYVVNTARGPVIDQQALIAALQAKRLAGAGLDVFEPEPLPADSPLLKMDNVITTPHNGGASIPSNVETKRRAMRNIANVLQGKWPPTRDLINPAVAQRPRLVPPRL
jgi:D-3-phosphoglycerate dehydrogenase